MPFQKGQSGNPKGRPPKENSLRALLRNQPVKDKRALVNKAYEEALNGNAKWAEWIARTSGEQGEQLEVSGKDGGPVFVLNVIGAQREDLG